jgi:hypothetical protein
VGDIVQGLKAATSVPLHAKRRLRAASDDVWLEATRLGYHARSLGPTSLDARIRSLPRPRRPMIWWTELDNITLHAPFDAFPRTRSGSWTVDGDWDLARAQRRLSVFEEADDTAIASIAHGTVRALFLEGADHRQTPQYDLMVRSMAVRRQGSARGCRTLDEVDAYFDRLRAAFASMARDGYLTQRELGRSGRDEMQLYATRDGQLCKRGGANHRVLMAEVLGIRWVPFSLSGLHPRWVEELASRSRAQPHRAVRSWPEHDPAIREHRPAG